MPNHTDSRYSNIFNNDDDVCSIVHRTTMRKSGKNRHDLVGYLTKCILCMIDDIGRIRCVLQHDNNVYVRSIEAKNIIITTDENDERYGLLRRQI